MALVGVGLVACGGDETVVVVGDVENPQVTVPAEDEGETPIAPVVDEPSSEQRRTGTTVRSAEPIPLRPDQPLHDACLDPPSNETSVESDVLTVDPETVSAGQDLTFRWNVAGRGVFTTGDEMIVGCWDGSGWMPVWYAFGAFLNPMTVVLTPDTVDRWSFTADGWSSSVGTVLIPVEARPGTYSLISNIVFGADGDQPTVVDAQAYFVVAG